MNCGHLRLLQKIDNVDAALSCQILLADPFEIYKSDLGPRRLSGDEQFKYPSASCFAGPGF